MLHIEVSKCLSNPSSSDAVRGFVYPVVGQVERVYPAAVDLGPFVSLVAVVTRPFGVVLCSYFVRTAQARIREGSAHRALLRLAGVVTTVRDRPRSTPTP